MKRLRFVASDLAGLRARVASHGFQSVQDAVEATTFDRLKAEAAEHASTAVAAARTTGVRYRARIATLGPRCKSFLFGDELLGFLATVFGEPVAPSEDRSCLTLYGEGDHLGLHRDEPASECAVTVILYLAVSTAPPSGDRTGLALHVYGRERPVDEAPRLTISTEPGLMVIGRGSTFWHERTALRAGERVSALTACYRLASTP